MNKTQLIDAVSVESGLTKLDARKAVDAFIKTVGEQLKQGEKIALVGFGTFSVSKRAARNGRNPQTGAVIKIKARKVAKFKAGKELSAKL